MIAKPKAYISGPISGIENGNVEIFRMYEEKLIDLGYDVIVPHDLMPEFDMALKNRVSLEIWDEYVWQMYMKLCIPEVVNSQLICTLNNWHGSRGARIETNLARDMRIPIIHYVNIKPAAEMLNQIIDIDYMIKAQLI